MEERLRRHHRFRRVSAKIPARMPRIIPAMKPPPTISLNIANGKMITSASAALPSIMTMAPSTIVRPMIAPSINAYAGPIAGSQMNIDDHNVQKDGARSAALFNRTSIPAINANRTAMMFLPPNLRAATRGIAGLARITWGLPQNGQ